jgi:hypothetical protein
MTDRQITKHGDTIAIKAAIDAELKGIGYVQALQEQSESEKQEYLNYSKADEAVTESRHAAGVLLDQKVRQLITSRNLTMEAYWQLWLEVTSANPGLVNQYLRGA